MGEADPSAAEPTPGGSGEKHHRGSHKKESKEKKKADKKRKKEKKESSHKKDKGNRVSAVSGKKIRMKVEKSAKDRELEHKRRAMLQFLNDSYD